MTYINISGYRFVKLDDVPAVQARLGTQCQALGLLGTILLSEEGINAFVSGTRSQIDAFYAFMNTQIPGIDFKESPSAQRPFKHMRVKHKAEIVTFGVRAISPAEQAAPYVTPERLKEWLDAGKEMMILDTRNNYEVEIGKFSNAVDLDIQNFRQFAQAIAKIPEDYKKKPIVTYCTGGIRCEKAAPFLMQQGFEEVYQLEGGILKYLELCGNAHYEGECFVFDKRMAVDHELQETDTVQCHVCRHPVTAEAQKSTRYSPGQSCPNCQDLI